MRKADMETVLWRTATTRCVLIRAEKPQRPVFVIVVESEGGGEIARAKFDTDQEASAYAIAQRNAIEAA